MSLTSTVASLAAAGAEGLDSPPPTWAFGVTAFAFFLVLLGVLWSFRNTAAKYDPPATLKTARPHRDTHGAHGSPGATDHGAHR
jgi:hypothetical protein